MRQSARARWKFLLGDIAQVNENPLVAFLKRSRVGHMGHLQLYAPSELQTMLEMLGFTCRTSFTQHNPEVLYYGVQNAAPTRRPLWRKVIKTPREFGAALTATTLGWIEQRVPHLRPQLFTVATKVADGNFEERCATEIDRLVWANE